MPSFNFPTVVAGVVLVLVGAGFALERLDLVSSDVLRLMPGAIALVIGGAMAYAAFGRKRSPAARKKPVPPKRHGRS